jgi:hypothetical protein
VTTDKTHHSQPLHSLHKISSDCVFSNKIPNELDALSLQTDDVPFSRNVSVSDLHRS